VVGQRFVRDLCGRLYMNPLYAFDGCFGTP
jgi:hypothetical protein